ncbi:hypothetical protein FQA39_LY07756 [Lamprigera yunnana]|nr:hypothetical protein FQA39_LY07756 [Lamprigera yunnana]
MSETATLNEQLIEVVKKYPFLFDKRERDYKNTVKKSRTWEKIAVKLHLTRGEDACKKWKSLRDRYARELKKLSDFQSTGTESQQLEVQTWDLFENLSFLRNHIGHNKRTVTNYTPNKVSLAQTSDETSCAESTSSNPSICVEQSSSVEYSTSSCTGNTDCTHSRKYKYTTNVDKIWITLGIIFTAIAAAASSLFSINTGYAYGLLITYVQTINRGVNTTEKTTQDQILMRSITSYVLTNVFFAAVVIIFSYSSIIAFNYTALNQTYKIRDLFFKSVLNQDMAWYDANQTGDFASRMGDDLKKIEEGIGEKAAMCLFYIMMCVFCVTAALFLGWELTLVSLISFPLILISMSLALYISSKFATTEMAAYGRAGRIAEEVFTALKTVVAFGGQQVEQDRYNKHLLFACNNNIRRSFFNGVGDAIKWLFLYVNYAVSFWYGAQLLMRNRSGSSGKEVYNVGTILSVFSCIYAAFWNYDGLTAYVEIFGIAKGAAAKIFAVIANEPIINKSKGDGEKYRKVEGKITFRNVHFSYPSRQNVEILKGLDLTVIPGETVALVGSSGCGKSTCIQLIQRHYDPTSGNIYIDDHKLGHLDLAWFRNHIGVVGQEPILFEATIAENIRLGRPNASFEDVKIAAKKANAHSFIQMLPSGYDTLVGERGTQLSGGQKQRIAIARALVRKPSILLLDEATSALDTNSEAIVQSAINSVASECTTVIVAHRLSTVRNADRIAVISDGRIKEVGKHEELMSKRGMYYELVIAQLREDDIEVEGASMDTLEDISEITKLDIIDDHKKKSAMQVLQEEKINYPSLLDVVKLNAPEKWIICFSCACSIVNGLCMPLFSILYGKIVGLLATENSYIESEINVYLYVLAASGFVIGLASLLQIYYLGISGEKLTMRLRSEMFKTFLSQEMAYFDDKSNSVGTLCGTLSSEAATVQGATGQRIGNIVNSITTVVIVINVSFYFDWRITLLSLCFTPLILLLVFLETRGAAKESYSYYRALQNSTKIAVEAISGIRTVSSLGCEDSIHSLYLAEVIPYQKMAKRNSHVRGIVYAVIRSVVIFAYTTIIYYGTILIKNEGLDYSTVLIVSMCVIGSSWALAHGFAFTPNFEKGLIAAKRIIQILNREPSIRDGLGDVDANMIRGNVEYENVWFSYPSRPKVDVLKGFNLSLSQGKTVALVGPSGCGKSTVVQLLERFYDPNSGTILIDDNLIKDMKLSTLRSQLGFVSQEPNLFSKTIADNIAYGDNSRQVSRMEIIRAAQKANIHDFITSLPLGYETELGEKGTQLSGGQKQRIAIARALVTNPKILLLDEATSALDTESENIVHKALNNAKQGRTCVIIAHRLSTIQDADVICVINQGRISEMGSHQQLLDLRGIYYNLYYLQH